MDSGNIEWMSFKGAPPVSKIQFSIHERLKYKVNDTTIMLDLSKANSKLPKNTRITPNNLLRVIPSFLLCSSTEI